MAPGYLGIEVFDVEVGFAKVRTNIGIVAAPRVPVVGPTLEDFEVLGIGHVMPVLPNATEMIRVQLLGPDNATDSQR